MLTTTLDQAAPAVPRLDDDTGQQCPTWRTRFLGWCLDNMPHWGGLAGVVAVSAAMFGPGASVLALVGIAMVMGWRKLYPHAPQAMFTAAVTAVYVTAVAVVSAVLGPWLVLAGSYDLAAGLLLAAPAVVLASWGLPSPGMHRGWTVLVGLLPGWVGLGTVVVMPSWSAAMALVAVIAGVALVWWRGRAAARLHPGCKRPAGRFVRVRKAAAVVGVGGCVLMGAGLAAPQATAVDLTFGMADKTMCKIASPSLATQVAGSGNEGVIGSYNMTGLPAKGGDAARFLDRELQWPDGPLDQYTLFELVGLRGVRYVNWVKDTSGESANCSFQVWGETWLGNLINKISLFLVQVIIYLKEFATVSDPFRFLYEPFTPAVNTMLSGFVGLFGLAFLVGIIVAVFRAVKGAGFQQTFQHASGALIATFVAAVAYGGLSTAATWNAPSGSGFYVVASTLDATGATINGAFANEVLSKVPDSEGSMCKKPGYTDTDGDVSQATAVGQRYSSCLLAEQLAYRPWALVQFGPQANKPIAPSATPAAAPDSVSKDGDPKSIPCYNNLNGCSDLRTYLLTQVGGPDISDKLSQCLTDQGYDSEKSETDNIDALRVCEPYHAVAEDLSYKADNGDHNSSYLSAWRGDNLNQSIQALSSLVGVLVVGIGIGAIAVATVYWHARLLILFISGPLWLAVGAFKGADWTMKWVSNVVQCIVTRILYGILTTLLIYFVAVLAAMDIGAGQRIVLMGVVLFGLLKAMGKADDVARIGPADGQGIGRRMDMTGAALGAAAGVVGPRSIAAVGRMGKSGAGKAASSVGSIRKNEQPNRVQAATKNAATTAQAKVAANPKVAAATQAVEGAVGPKVDALRSKVDGAKTAVSDRSAVVRDDKPVSSQRLRREKVVGDAMGRDDLALQQHLARKDGLEAPKKLDRGQRRRVTNETRNMSEQDLIKSSPNMTAEQKLRRLSRLPQDQRQEEPATTMGVKKQQSPNTPSVQPVKKQPTVTPAQSATPSPTDKPAAKKTADKPPQPRHSKPRTQQGAKKQQPRIHPRKGDA